MSEAKEILQKLSDDGELSMFLFDDHEICDDFESVTIEKVTYTRRWHTHYEQVFRHKDGTYWRFNWMRGSTEYQDDGPEDISFIEVEPKEATIIEYVPKV